MSIKHYCTALWCCRYFFWDDYHPTEAVNGAMAKALWSGNQYVSPFNLSTLVRMR